MKSKHYVFALLPLCVIGVVFRTFELINGVEHDTLFYKTGSYFPLAFDLFLGLALVFILSALFSLKREKKALDKAVVRIHGAEKTVLLVYAVITLSAALFGFYEALVDAGSSGFAEVFAGFDFFKALSAILIVAFISAYASAPKQFGRSTGFKLFSLTLTLYYIIRLLDTFINKSMITMSYKSVDVLFCGFAVLFFFSFSKALAGMYARKGLYAFGCATVFLAAIKLGNLSAVLFSAGKYSLGENFLVFASDILLAVVVVIIMLKPISRAKIAAGANNEPTDDTVADGNT